MAQPAPGRILIVDDEPTMLRLCERLLRTDFDVVAVSSGFEARDRLAAGEQFDLVVCDLMMPGMSGMDLFAEVRTRWPGLAARVLFCTAGADAPDHKAFLATAPIGYVTKPFKPLEFRALVHKLSAPTAS